MMGFEYKTQRPCQVDFPHLLFVGKKVLMNGPFDDTLDGMERYFGMGIYNYATVNQALLMIIFGE